VNTGQHDSGQKDW